MNYKKILPGRSEGVFVSSSEFCVNWFRFHLLNIFFAKVTAILLNTKPNDLSFTLLYSQTLNPRVNSLVINRAANLEDQAIIYIDYNSL